VQANNVTAGTFFETRYI